MTLRKSVTIYDIAKEVNISPSMVSRVLSGKGSVSDKTRKKIQDVIDKYEYRPNAMARGLQKNRTQMIGFMIPHIGNEYFSKTYYEFEKYASANGYMIMLANGKNDIGAESRILGVFEEARVEGIIIMGGRIDTIDLEERHIEEIRKLNERVPCILCSEMADRFGCVGTHMDSTSVARKLVDYLHSKGYKSLGILGGANSRYPSVAMKDGIKKEAFEKGILVKEEWIHGVSYDEYDGAEAMRELLKQKELPRAVCCINDTVAFGAMDVAMDAGLRIPEDIAFTGNDGLHISEMCRPRLTTIAADFEKMGKTLYEMMQARMEEREVENYLIQPKLIIRQST